MLETHEPTARVQRILDYFSSIRLCLGNASEPKFARPQRNGIWNGGDWMIFLRVIVSSLTAKRIENAKAYLVSIEKDSKTIWDNEELPLTFSPGENPDALCKTIEHGGSYPVDVIIVRRGDDELFVGTPGRTWPHFESLHNIFAEKGDYILNVRVSADDCPSILARVKFWWGGDSYHCGIDVMPLAVLES